MDEFFGPDDVADVLAEAGPHVEVYDGLRWNGGQAVSLRRGPLPPCWDDVPEDRRGAVIDAALPFLVVSRMTAECRWRATLYIGRLSSDGGRMFEDVGEGLAAWREALRARGEPAPSA